MLPLELEISQWRAAWYDSAGDLCYKRAELWMNVEFGSGMCVMTTVWCGFQRARKQKVVHGCE